MQLRVTQQIIDTFPQLSGSLGDPLQRSSDSPGLGVACDSRLCEDSSNLDEFCPVLLFNITFIYLLSFALRLEILSIFSLCTILDWDTFATDTQQSLSLLSKKAPPIGDELLNATCGSPVRFSTGVLIWSQTYSAFACRLASPGA